MRSHSRTHDIDYGCSASGFRTRGLRKNIISNQSTKCIAYLSLKLASKPLASSRIYIGQRWVANGSSAKKWLGRVTRWEWRCDPSRTGRIQSWHLHPFQVGYPHWRLPMLVAANPQDINKCTSGTSCRSLPVQLTQRSLKSHQLFPTDIKHAHETMVQNGNK